MAERDAARNFLGRIGARGGTELARAIGAAAKILGKEGGDILVMTDGQVFGTESILKDARAAGVRLHCLGIGSASQDRFLALLARQTGGVSRFLTPRERVDVPAVDLFASIGRPVASGLAVQGATVLSEIPETVLAGTPLLMLGETDGAGPARLRVKWDGGQSEVPIEIGESPLGETLRLLTGARLIADMDSRVVSHDREELRVAKRLEDLSRQYGLASRRMALVAVVERAGDRAGDVPKTVVVAVGMPQDTAFGAYFPAPQQSMPMYCLASSAMPPAAPMAPPPSPRALGRSVTGAISSLFKRKSEPAAEMDAPPPIEPASMAPPAGNRDTDDLLLEMVSRILPDGGMPGENERERIAATIITLMLLLEQGHTLKRGAFRSHVGRLTRYLEGLEKPELEEVLEAVKAGKVLEGNWGTGQPADCPILTRLGLIA
jgi:hypothetical protein